MSENNFDEEAKKQAEEERNFKDAKGCLFGFLAFAAVLTIASGIYQTLNPPKEPQAVTTTTKTETRANNEGSSLDKECIEGVSQEIADREYNYGDNKIDRDEAESYTREFVRRCRK